MKHAGEATLDAIEPVLVRLRKVADIQERKRGVFYRKSSAFIHFHEDPAGVFADVRCAEGWVRMPVNTAEERKKLFASVTGALK
jgi:hypothetical protein